MKKTLSVMLAICLLVLCLPLSAAQAAASMRGELYRLINQERVKAGLSALNTSSSELQPENDCFDADDTPAPSTPSGNVSLAMCTTAMSP